MKFTLRLGTACGAFTLLLMGLMLLIRAGTNEDIPPLALLTNPDGTPCLRLCLFGIRPGETTITEAAKILHTHPLLANLSSNGNGDSMDSYSNDQFDIRIIRETSNPSIVAIYVSDTKLRLPHSALADYLQRIHTPLSVGWTSDTLTLVPTIIIPGERLMLDTVLGDPARLSMGDRVYSFALMDEKYFDYVLSTYTVKPWLGFASLRRYGLTP